MASAQTVRYMGVVKVAGDGSCLFHSLAFHEGCGGEALKVEIIDFIDNVLAAQDEALQEEWLQEAEHLRGDAAWGGHMAIVAYSAMREKRVVVHTRLGEGGVQVQEQSHEAVYGNSSLPTVHILYNGEDHYDAMVELADATGMEPATPEEATGFPPLRAALLAPRRQRARFGVPRASKQEKKKGKSEVAEEEASKARHRRYTEKTTPAPELQDTLLEELATMRVASTSAHPHREVEDLIQDFADKKLREQPTIPPDTTSDDLEFAARWPRAFCAFEGCKWASEQGGEDDLEAHLWAEHLADLQPIVRKMLRRDAPDALLSAYNAGISHKCRQQAPVACASLDRKALLSFAEAQAGDKVEALVCWSCGCSHAYVQEIAAKGNIQWRRPLESPPNAATDKSYFLGRPTNE
ncbi:ATP-dependent DNA helicase, partial [Durusdinium trenchii]